MRLRRDVERHGTLSNGYRLQLDVVGRRRLVFVLAFESIDDKLNVERRCRVCFLQSCFQPDNFGVVEHKTTEGDKL